MDDFTSELEAGFAELEQHTSVGVSFGGIPLTGIMGVAGLEHTGRLDVNFGPGRKDLHLNIRRSVFASAGVTVMPKAGGVFTYGGKQLRIIKVDDEDPNDPVIGYEVKLSG